MKPAGGVAALERLEALIANPALYELAELVPEQDPSRGGRRRQYPVYMWLLYDALLSVYGSARQVEVELAHPLVWKHLCSLIRKRFPHDPHLRLPERPMRRHHYLYARTRWLTDPGILAGLRDTHRRLAVEQARSLGLLDPEGPGSWTHPDLSGTVALIDRVRERGGPVGSSDQITLVNSSNAAASRRCSWRASKSSS